MSTPFDAFSEKPAEPTPEMEPEEILLDTSTSEVEGAEEPLATEEATTLPPEARGETNGGPLGCCLGSVSGLFLTVLVITLISITVTNQRYLSPGWIMVPAALLGAIVGGWIGWRIGKAIYREYELSPERRARLEHIDQQWQNKHNKPIHVQRAKTR